MRPDNSPGGLYHSAFPAAVWEHSECSTSSPTLDGICLVGFHHSGGCVVGSGCVFIHILLVPRKIVTLGGDCGHEIKRCLIPGRKAMTNLDSIKKQTHHFASKGSSGPSYGFSSSHIPMGELDHKEGWALKNWWFWIVVLVKNVVSPLDCKEIQTVHPKGDQSWVSLEGLVLKLKLQYFGHLMQRSDSQGKTLMLGKTEGKRRRDDRGLDGWMAHWLNGHEFEQAQEDSEGQETMAWCSPWSRKESDRTWWLNNNYLRRYYIYKEGS